MSGVWRVGVAGPQLSSTVRHRVMTRLLLLLAIALVFGVVATYAVAWICATWAPVRTTTWIDSESPFPIGASWPCAVPEDWPPWATERISSKANGYLSHQAWSRGVPGEPLEVTLVALIDEVGWPVRALGRADCSVHAQGSTMAISLATMDAKSRLIVLRQPPHVLAASPLWPGFVIDWLFYSLVCLSLYAATSLRRHLKHHRVGTTTDS